MKTTTTSIQDPSAWQGEPLEEGEALRRAIGASREAAPGSTRESAVPRERHEVIVIGGGQAGLSVGYHLARRGIRFVILDASARVGDAWRERWDSLRLFSSARFSALDGLPFPGPQHRFPHKDEMAAYLESYAAHFQLPVRSGVRVARLTRTGDGRYLVEATVSPGATGAADRPGTLALEADQVVVAMSSHQRPRVPAFARDLRPDIVQVHSKDYRNPGQLRSGPVLIVGSGNSGADIAMDLAPKHQVWLAGRDVGQVPFEIEGRWARLFLIRLVMRVIFHRVLTIRTPMGRKARPQMIAHGGPLVRLKRAQLRGAGVVRVPRVVGVRDGLPELEDGRVLDVANVVWAAGFDAGFSWIDLPIFTPPATPRGVAPAHAPGEPVHRAGLVDGAPGLYFVGLHFLYAASSAMIHGVGRDASRIADAVAARQGYGAHSAARTQPS